MANIEYDDSKLQREIKAAIRQYKNPDSLMKLLGVTAQTGIERNFDKEEDSKKRKWKPLTPSTVKQRRKKGAGAKILQDTGKLRRINYQKKRLGVRVGTGADYGVHHQYGTVNIPKREWLYISDSTRKRMDVAIKKWITQKADVGRRVK